MDKKTFDALKGSDHPNIKYTIESVTTGSGKITANGHLELAGVRKSVSVQANASPSGSNAINFEGTVDLKMTDFDMEPPRALLGTLKTGDDIVVHYNLTYKSN